MAVVFYFAEKQPPSVIVILYKDSSGRKSPLRIKTSHEKFLRISHGKNGWW